MKKEAKTYSIEYKEYAGHPFGEIMMDGKVLFRGGLNKALGAWEAAECGALEELISHLTK